MERDVAPALAHSSLPGVALAAVLVAAYLALVLLAAGEGSPLVPPLIEGGAAPSWLSGAIRFEAGATVVTALAAAIVAVAAFAFIALIREALAGRVRPRLVSVAAAVSVGATLLVPPLLSRDVYSYASYGRIAAVHGGNPYAEAPADHPDDPFTLVGSPAWLRSPSVYGPVFTLASAAIASGSRGSPPTAVFLFKLLAVVAVAAAAALAALAARRTLGDGAAAAAVVMVGLNPVVVIHVAGGGHNDALVMALLAAAAFVWTGSMRTHREPDAAANGHALRTRVRRRDGVVTFLLALAALVKVVAVVALAVHLWHVTTRDRDRERTSFAWRPLAAQTVLALAVAVAAFIPFLEGGRPLSAIASAGGREGWASGPRFVARAVEAAMPGAAPSPVARTIVYMSFWALFGFVLARLLMAIRGTERPGVAASVGVAMLLFALAAPYLLPWYAAWFLPFAVLFRDRVLTWVAVAASALLAITGIPAEPAPNPDLWEGMLLVVHYAVAPVMLALLFVAVRRVLRVAESAAVR